MATRIRLRRVGRKKQATFRIVVAGSIHARSGRITETIGKYNPRTHPSYVEIDEVRALHWLRQGARLSESVEPLFRKAGILQKFAEGAAGEGVTVIGDGQGKTVLATRPAAARSGAATEEPEAEAKEEPKAEAKAEAKEETKAEPEAKAEAKEEAEEAAEAKDEPKAEADEEPKGETEEKPKAKAKTKAKGEAEAEGAAEGAESEEPEEAAESAEEEEK